MRRFYRWLFTMLFSCSMIIGSMPFSFAENGDIINVNRQILYPISSGKSEVVQALIADVKANPTHKFLREENGKWVDPRALDQAQTQVVQGMIQQANLRDRNEIVSYLKANLQSLLQLITQAMDAVERITLNTAGFQIYSSSVQNHLQSIDIKYAALLKFHTIVVNVSEDVAKVEANGIIMHYEGNNQFSLATTTLTGSQVEIKAYDRSNQLLETKQSTVPKN